MAKLLIDEDTLNVVIDALNIAYLTAKGETFQKIFYARQRLLKEMQKADPDNFGRDYWEREKENRK